MEAFENISTQTRFIMALYNVEIDRLATFRWTRISPSSIIRYFRRLTRIGIDDTEPERDKDERRASRLSLRIAQTLPLLGAPRVTSDQILNLRHILERLKWQMETIVHNRGRNPIQPYRLVEKAVQQFIKLWNNLLTDLEGKWLFQYGTVFRTELHIRDVSQLSFIVDQVLQIKLLRYLDFNSREDYQREKQLAQRFVSFTKCITNLS